METVTAEPRVPPRLTKSDRCDRCGAQAIVTILLHSGLDLIMCRHHYREHFSALFPLAAHIRDWSRELLGAK